MDGTSDAELHHQLHHVDLGSCDWANPSAIPGGAGNLGPDLLGGDFGLSLGPSGLLLRYQIRNDLPSGPHRLGISNGCPFGWGVAVFREDKLGESGRCYHDNRGYHYCSEVMRTFSLWTLEESDTLDL